MSIEVSHLCKSYGTQRAVDDISFSVGRGEIVGFLGPNGAGKSTTMRMLTGYLPPASGTARVCGLDVTARPLEVRRRTGYLPESNPLYADMYIREYLDFVAAVYRIPRRRRRERIAEMIRLTGLTREQHKKIGMLSKGYRQRVGLAQALIHDPEVLILDEPGSGLDPNQIVEIRQLIRQLGQEKTVILSTHILQEVEALCTRVVIIHEGRLVADNRLEQLRSQAGQQMQVLVEFAGAASREQLEALPGVSAALPLEGGRWQLSGPDPEPIRKNLLQFALQNNLNIVSLQSQSSSLEEVFRKLTTP
ncbi:gliding motility-associated ABC transporter ATP-binding subunit GldA [Compostibacter hankyongensis]|uniref:Gliding motility-associated ABC transporter ATP-binding subunit GldA n=1 Tax=Compostibacter hankyongensis TaxID=1007089 RepID=A0ABP8FFH0_9BACT